MKITIGTTLAILALCALWSCDLPPVDTEQDQNTVADTVAEEEVDDPGAEPFRPGWGRNSYANRLFECADHVSRRFV